MVKCLTTSMLMNLEHGDANGVVGLEGSTRFDITMTLWEIQRCSVFLEGILRTWYHNECTGNPEMFHGFLEGILQT